MKNGWIFIACLCGVIATLTLTAQPRTPKPNGQVQAQAQSQAQTKQSLSPTYSSDGERVFKENCSRCHDAPQSFSPQISGTVIRHMRVRASLSEQDEKAILKFLNP
jgi:cytochrome c5